MQIENLPRQAQILLSVVLLGAGLALLVWALSNIPRAGDSPTATVLTPVAQTTAGDLASGSSPASADSATAAGEPQVTRTVQDNGDAQSEEETTQPATAAPAQAPITVRVDAAPPTLQTLTSQIAISQSLVVTTSAPTADPVVGLTFDANGEPVQEVVFAAASRFDTVLPLTTWPRVQAAWSGAPLEATEVELPATGTITGTATLPVFEAVAVLSDTLPALVSLLGDPGDTVQGYASMADLTSAAWSDTPTLAFVPFDQLEPRLTVLAIDGQNPVENANRFDADAYPFKTMLYAQVDAANAEQQRQAQAYLAQIPPTNRDPDKLTVLAMTGVTAMVRLTAAQIDERGPEWVAEVVGPELAAADITHISNEVPFVPDCVTNTRMDNFNFCSPPEYFAALEATGTDIIGLTGNHQNDFGRDDALVSIDFYAEKGLPLFGGGRNKAEAFAPLFLEHNGNRLAFLGANSYGPEFAWATDTQPGSAIFDLAIMSATIRNIKQKDLADIVLPELQYQESYAVQPLGDQRLDFNALVRAGADIVTGVQSHVPQAMEFTDDSMVLFGLGNLFFDQMWAENTREGMIVKHTFYDGRHVSTQVLTTLIYNFGQPRWMSAAERETLLERVFGASYW